MSLQRAKQIGFSIFFPIKFCNSGARVQLIIDATNIQGKWRRLGKLGLKVVIPQVWSLNQQHQNHLGNHGTTPFLMDITLGLWNQKVWRGPNSLCFNIFWVFLVHAKCKTQYPKLLKLLKCKAYLTKESGYQQSREGY